MNKCRRTWEWHSIAINIMYFNFFFHSVFFFKWLRFLNRNDFETFTFVHLLCTMSTRWVFGRGDGQGEHSKWTQQIHRWYANFLHFISENFPSALGFVRLPNFFFSLAFLFLHFLLWDKVFADTLQCVAFDPRSPLYKWVSECVRVCLYSLCTLCNVNVYIYNIVARIHLPIFNRIDYTFHSIHLVHFPLFISSICHRIVSICRICLQQ